MPTEALVIGGGGYVGRLIAGALRQGGCSVTTTSRFVGRADLVVPSGPALDEVLATRHYGHIVHLPQLTAVDGDFFLDRIDGPRWLVFSSAQLASNTPAARTELALAREETALHRGAAVLRPTMIFGRGGDANISRIIRFLRRYRLPLVMGDGQQLVQPIHVDDVAALAVAHARGPRSGMFEVGGDRRLSVKDLMDELRGALGVRKRTAALPTRSLHLMARLPIPGVRPDQIRRLLEDKVVDNTRVGAAFGWSPAPLRPRLEQAIDEAR